jgi:hypothetical protein
MRVKIAKGVFWKAEEMGIQPIRPEVMRFLESGTLYLTNRRLIFVGMRTRQIIRLASIQDFDAFSNGIALSRRFGRDPFLAFHGNVDIFAMIMGRAISDLGG